MAEVSPNFHEQLMQMKRVVNHFQSGWKSGNRPRAEVYVETVPQELRSTLLMSLLAIEVEMRHETAEPCSAGELIRRFPEYPEEVQAVVSRRLSATSTEQALALVNHEAEPKSKPSSEGADQALKAAPAPGFRSRVRALIATGDYAAALRQLAEVSRNPDFAGHKDCKWAIAQIPKVKRQREVVRAGRQDTYDAAKQLADMADYRQAISLLHEYPIDLRTPRMQKLLERLEGHQEEVDSLWDDIKLARKRGHNRTLAKLVDRLLAIQPNHLEARRIQKRIRLFDSVRRRTRIFGRVGKKARKSSFVSQAIVVLAALIMIKVACGEFFANQDYHQSLQHAQTLLRSEKNASRETVLAMLSGNFAMDETETGIRLCWRSWFRPNEYVLNCAFEDDVFVGLSTKMGAVDALEDSSISRAQSVASVERPYSPDPEIAEDTPENVAVTINACGWEASSFRLDVASAPELSRIKAQHDSFELVTHLNGCSQSTNGIIQWKTPSVIKDSTVVINCLCETVEGARVEVRINLDVVDRDRRHLKTSQPVNQLKWPDVLKVDPKERDRFIQQRERLLSNSYSKEDCIRLVSTLSKLAGANPDTEKNLIDLARDVSVLGLLKSTKTDNNDTLTWIIARAALQNFESGNFSAGYSDIKTCLKYGLTNLSLLDSPRCDAIHATALRSCLTEMTNHNIVTQLSGSALFSFDLRGKDVEGRDLKLSEYRGRVVLIDVFATWCGPCRVAARYIEELKSMYSPAELIVVGVSDDDDTEVKIRKFITDNKITYRCGRGNKVLFKMIPGFNAFPTLLLVDKSGRVRWQGTGAGAVRKAEKLVPILLAEN